MFLLELLLKHDGQSIAITGENSLSYATLLNNAQEIRKKYAFLHNQKVALSFTDLASFTSALIAFDGWCKALYLLPEHNIALPDEVYTWPVDTIIHSQKKQHQAVNTQWFLATSGTTGKPKWISHSADSLCRAIKINNQSKQLRWALCYQPCRFAGLQVLLQSLLSGATLVDCSQSDASIRIEKMLRYHVNALSATPSLWRQLLMTNKIQHLNLTHATLGGEIADQTLLDTLASLFPSAKLLHIYASTEAGVGFAVADKKAGFPIKWLGSTTSGIQLKINNNHLWIKPTQVPDNHIKTLLDAEGYLNTGDLVHVSHDRVLFLGRASGVINVGGNKVHPEQIEQVLLMHPNVQQVKVYGKNSSILGQLVVADIVSKANTNSKTLQLDLITHCKAHLERYQIPTRFNIVTSLQTNATGKLIRHTNEQKTDE